MAITFKPNSLNANLFIKYYLRWAIDLKTVIWKYVRPQAYDGD